MQAAGDTIPQLLHHETEWFVQMPDTDYHEKKPSSSQIYLT
jgi:hypothetical protein